MRTSAQLHSDFYTTLYLIDCVNKRSSVDGNLKIQKLLFLHEFRGIQSQLKSNHYKYFRYNFGPYSKELANDIVRLEDAGILSKASRKLTKRGSFFLEYFYPEVHKAISRGLEYVDEICESYGKLSGPKLVDKVYRLSVPVSDWGGEYEKVRDIPTFTDIFDPLHDNENTELPPIDEETLKQMEHEISIEPEDIDPSSLRFKKAVNEHIERVLA